LVDARDLYARGNYKSATKRAADSIAYSVGKSHRDYFYVAGLPQT
jgi:hypothetical protein